MTTTPGVLQVRDENIFVTVRVRPLSREQSLNDRIAWECTDKHTISSNILNNKRKRSTVPYTFARVFDTTCSTHTVYEEGIRDIALSPLTAGVNATIYAYGQTSSGKTFTMRGITDSVVKDIYTYIRNSPDSHFVLKISGLEVYNEGNTETVVDLLNRDSGRLRLLDHPEKGTIVENLVEEDVKDSNHLRSLITTCEAQRQVGETAHNDMSSRSHQIIRLTIESCSRGNSTHVKSCVASLNLVDLAGSESQRMTRSKTLKEGSHINHRSLLALGNVIRKLSAPKKTDPVSYRESKLTRILQPSLGGNSRTAIICTMSPASSHMQQSLSTLSFACSAKEVKNTVRHLATERESEQENQSPQIVDVELPADHMRNSSREDYRGNSSKSPQIVDVELPADHMGNSSREDYRGNSSRESTPGSGQISVLKRKRGRPKAAPKAAPKEEPKRPRGRPRKLKNRGLQLGRPPKKPRVDAG